MTDTYDFLKAQKDAIIAKKEAAHLEVAKYIVDAEKRIKELETQLAQYKVDAERFIYLLNYHSYDYPMQPDSPAEHGIEYHWQQGSYEERNHGIRTSIDTAIAARKEDV